MANKPLNVGIIGGGIAGLTVAVLLRQSGVDVTVFERSRALSGHGAGVQLSSNGVKVLRRLGVEHEIQRVAYSPTQIKVINARNGKVVLSLPLGEKALKRYSENFFQIHRTDLIQVLLKKAEEVGVRINLASDAIMKSSNGDFSEIISNKKKFLFDMAIAADGVHSLTRDRFFKTSKPEFLNQIAYRTTIPLDKVDSQFSDPEVKIFIGSGGHIVSYPLLSRSLLNLVFCKHEDTWTSDGWSISVKKLELKNKFHQFSEIRPLLDKIDNVKKWGLFGYKNNNNWTTKNLALIGDACHPMLPYLAQGANQALEDALALSYFITPNNGFEVVEGLKRYAANRKDRVLRVQKAAIRNAAAYHLQSGVVRFLAHRGLGFVSKVMPNFVISRFDWLYRYEFNSNY